MADADDLAATIASSQFGVITRAQASELGMTEHQIRYRVKTCCWRPLGPGAFLVGQALPTWQAEVLEACLTLDAVASHRTAAALWGLTPPVTCVEVTVPHNRYRRRPGVSVYSTKQPDHLCAVRFDGIRTSGIERTLLDIAALLQLPELLSIIQLSLDRGLTTLESLAQAEICHHQRGRPGVTRFRQALSQLITELARATLTGSHDELPAGHK